MIKETRSLVRLLRARLHKGVAHQWFLNQYVKKHKLESSIICNKLIEYDSSKRIISFKSYSPHITKKSLRPQYNVETATLVLLKDISQVGGGWLGEIVMCSSCIRTLQETWKASRISFSRIQQILDTTHKTSPHCICGHEKRKILTACKPIYITHTHGKTEDVFGLISNSFVVPEILYDINHLIYTPADKFRQLMETEIKHKDSGLLKPLFISLLQLIFFWLKNGPATTHKLFNYYVDDLKEIRDLAAPVDIDQRILDEMPRTIR